MPIIKRKGEKRKMIREFEIHSNLVQRKGWKDLVQHMEEIGYFIAPASTSHHSALPEGLVRHSCKVTDIMLTTSKGLYPALSEESIRIVGLCHDLGKAGYYGVPYYEDNILKSGKRSDSKPYECNDKLLAIPHETSSLHIVSKFIQLTQEEAYAILYHNGLYTPAGSVTKGNERPLQQLIHFADMYESRFGNMRYEEKQYVGGMF